MLRFGVDIVAERSEAGEYYLLPVVVYPYHFL